MRSSFSRLFVGAMSKKKSNIRGSEERTILSKEEERTLISAVVLNWPLSMEEVVGAPVPLPPPKRKGGRPKAPRCNECKSCHNPHWKMPCEQKALLEGPTESRGNASSWGRATVVAEPPVAPSKVAQREALRVETLGDDRELRKQLSYLLKVPLGDVGRIRMSPEKQPSLIDVISILTKKNKNESSEVWRKLESK